MATMRDVASRANVSVATVSAVINNTAFVTPELTQRVLASIEGLQYKPNVLAKFLRFNKTSTICVIMQDVQNPFYPAVVKGIEDTAWSMDYIVSLCNGNGHIQREVSFLQSMIQRKVDGVLLLTCLWTDNPLIDILGQENIPYVIVNRRPKDIRGKYYIGFDNKAAAKLAVQHLVGTGRRRIALIQGPESFSTSSERSEGYQEAVKKHGLSVPDGCMARGDYTVEGGYRAMNGILRQGELPDGVFCSNDLMAIGAIECLLENGIRVPEDVSVMGCDNIDFGKYSRVPLSTVHVPKYEMGEQAVKMMVQLLNDPSAGIKQKSILKPRLVIRESCGGSEREGNG